MSNFGMDGIFIFSTILSAILLVIMAVAPQNGPGITKFLLSLAVLIITSPAILATLVLFAAYQRIIAWILKMKYGSKFQGPLPGFEVLTVANKPAMVINVVWIVHFKSKTGNIYETIKEEMQRIVFDHPEQHPKFMATYHKFLGYYFRLTKDVGVGDCLRKMEKIESETEEVDADRYIELITENYGNSALPGNDAVLWEVVVGTQPIKWPRATKRNGDGGKLYPLLIRIHHGIADGVALLKFMTSIVADHPGLDVVSPKVARNVSSAEASRSLKDYGSMLYSLALAPAVIFGQLVSKGREENITQGPALRNKQFFAMVPEESTDYIGKIKRIKRMVPGASFADVLLTAYSMCLRDYFKQYTTFRPNYVTTAIPVLPGSSHVQNMVPGESVDHEIGLTNRFSFVVPRIPVFASNSDPTLLGRLKLVMDETSYSRNFVEYQINYWFTHTILGLLPYCLVRMGLDVKATSYISIMVGPRRIDLGRGSMQLESLGAWLNLGNTLGMGFVCVTYGGRLHLGFSVDRALIAGNKDVKDVFKNMYKYLDLIETEIAPIELKSS